MQQAPTSVASGKCSQRIKNCESMRNLSFPIRNIHICCGPLATQHARWHKNIILQEVEPSLRVTLGSPCELQLCVSKAILHFWRPSRAWKSCFFMKFHHLTRTLLHPCETFASLKIFPYCMYGAEALHTARYNLSGRRKNAPGE